MLSSLSRSHPSYGTVLLDLFRPTRNLATHMLLFFFKYLCCRVKTNTRLAMYSCLQWVAVLAVMISCPMRMSRCNLVYDNGEVLSSNLNLHSARHGFITAGCSAYLLKRIKSVHAPVIRSPVRSVGVGGS